jgi:hypothetical protein
MSPCLATGSFTVHAIGYDRIVRMVIVLQEMSKMEVNMM